MTRAEASRSPLRCTTPLISSASTATVSTVNGSVFDETCDMVSLYRCSPSTAATVAMPVTRVVRQEKSGAAISGAAEKSGEAVNSGGVERSS
jgi:hypothetical protein